jgi:hypothetical protein
MDNKPNITDRMYSPTLDAVMREVLHTLGNFDFQKEVEQETIEESVADEELKRYIKDKIRAAHRVRCEPDVDLLNKLRTQQHRQFVA